MVPVIPDPRRTKGFATAAAFERWLSAHHATETELWLKIHKKASGLKTVTYAEALDVALCWGWIDGLKKSFDETSFLQRFTPRQSKSIWSQVNRDHVQRLTDAGRMTEHGQRQIDLAKADGRWAAAYAPIRNTSSESLPDDLLAAIGASPKALATFRTLGKMNLFALAFRTNSLKTPAGRARKIASLVAMLERGETIVPEKVRGSSSAKIVGALYLLLLMGTPRSSSAQRVDALAVGPSVSLREDVTVSDGVGPESAPPFASINARDLALTSASTRAWQQAAKILGGLVVASLTVRDAHSQCVQVVSVSIQRTVVQREEDERTRQSCPLVPVAKALRPRETNEVSRGEISEVG
jgi:uncharacterized protein YdeI (YjbR/CyaY-like superfamily)